ncbi:2TM domain-containing protein [Hyphomonas sp.]|uniref:2TM domain-containing protein n=1 Tax=Hyphomonas sp. TaxID=87 RepID=UPI003527DE72
MGIQERRLEHGWSQEDLALHTGLSVRTIQRIETGKRASLESLKSLAAVFETSVSELVEDQTMTPENKTGDYFNELAEKEAIEHVKNVKAFHMNWTSFLVILPLLYILNIQLSPEFMWVWLVALCWGAAIGLHALVIFGMFSLFGAEWEQREFRKRMNRHNR